jgi:signal transduction histidine kinase
VRGRAIGFINFGAFTGVRRFEQADLKLAEEFALRVAVALDNARLFAGEQRARTTVEEALKLRDVFLSVAAHELRTPITVLHGTLGLMKRRLERGIALSERDHRSIYTLLNQTRRLDRLIAALLDISRIQTGQLTLERSQIDLCALVRRVVDEVQPALEQHTIECDVLDEATLIEGDALRLEQVIQNLINNAIKYSPHGGPISVRVTRQMEQVCLSVSDQGIGIPPSAQDRLFERFYRAANVDSNKFGGLGIGLYVVKEITTLHGGTVSVQSVEGVGSTFTVCFPAAQPTPALTPS